MYKSILLLSFTIVCHASAPPPRKRCKFGDACWPDEQTWHTFNNSIFGRLVTTYPSAAVCHGQKYNAASCNVVREQWDNSFWRTNQTGAYTAIVWELGIQQCFINSSRSAPCQPGLGELRLATLLIAELMLTLEIVPHYSVVATSIADIQAAVKFADEKDLYLVVKNTGHDQYVHVQIRRAAANRWNSLGRSSGQGAFSIWTHNLKGREWTDSFVVEDAPVDIQSVPAVTLRAGEQWLGKLFPDVHCSTADVLDVYRAAAGQHVIVVGGHARTVGAAGGWLTGGGHSVWSNLYGLGVDSKYAVVKLLNES